MTTTLWIVGMIAVAVIGAATGYYKGLKDCKSPVAAKRLLSILDKLDNDNDLFHCMKSCKDRRTPDEDINIHLRKIACKFTDKEMDKQAVFDKAMEATTQSNIEAAESVINLCYTCLTFGSCIAADSNKKDCAGYTSNIHVAGMKVKKQVEQSNIEAAESAKDCEGDDCGMVYGGQGEK